MACGQAGRMVQIEFTNGSERLRSEFFPGAGAWPSPAVLLFPAIAGVNDYIRRVGTRLAAAGYSTQILDYYAREGSAPDVSTPEKIGTAVQSLPDMRVLSDAKAAIGALRNPPDVDADRVAISAFASAAPTLISRPARPTASLRPSTITGPFATPRPLRTSPFRRSIGPGSCARHCLGISVQPIA